MAHHSDHRIILLSAIIAVILNVTLAFSLSAIASEKQSKPPNGASELGYVDQFMHMLVHHKQTLLVSSVIVALVVALSVMTAFRISARMRTK